MIYLDLSYLTTKVTSHSFTDPYAGSIYKELIDLGADVGEDISPLDINVDSASIPQALHDAVADLGENELMKASRNFVVRRVNRMFVWGMLISNNHTV